MGIVYANIFPCIERKHKCQRCCILSLLFYIIVLMKIHPFVSVACIA